MSLKKLNLIALMFFMGSVGIAQVNGAVGPTSFVEKSDAVELSGILPPKRERPPRPKPIPRVPIMPKDLPK